MADIKEQFNIPDNFTRAVIMRESSGNPTAISKTGARGLMQIMPIVLEEYNNMNKTKHTLDDLFVPDTNIKIGSWYLNKRIPQMLRHYKLDVTPETILWAYHDGIGNVKKGYQSNNVKSYIPKVMETFGSYK